MVESILGFKFQGFSVKIVIGIKNMVPHINIDAVTFSFFLLLIFKVSKPPTT